MQCVVAYTSEILRDFMTFQALWKYALCMHLDLIKTRFQIQRGPDDPTRYKSMADCVKTMYQFSGVRPTLELFIFCLSFTGLTIMIINHDNTQYSQYTAHNKIMGYITTPLIACLPTQLPTQSPLPASLSKQPTTATHYVVTAQNCVLQWSANE